MLTPQLLYEGTIACTGIVTPDLKIEDNFFKLENGLLDPAYVACLDPQKGPHNSPVPSQHWENRIIPIHLRNIESNEIEKTIEVAMRDDGPDCTIDNFFNDFYPRIIEKKKGHLWCYRNSDWEELSFRISPSGDRLVTHILKLDKLIVTDVNTNQNLMEETVPPIDSYYPSSLYRDIFFIGAKAHVIMQNLYSEPQYPKSLPIYSRKNLEYRLHHYILDFDTNSIASKIIMKNKGEYSSYGHRMRPYFVSKDEKYVLLIYNRSITDEEEGYTSSLHFLNLLTSEIEHRKRIYSPLINKIKSENQWWSTQASVQDTNTGYVHILSIKHDLSESNSTQFGFYTLDFDTGKIIDTDKFEFNKAKLYDLSNAFFLNGNIIAEIKRRVGEHNSLEIAALSYDISTHTPTFGKFNDVIYDRVLKEPSLVQFQRVLETPKLLLKE